jgi:hypothetical protein
MLMASDISGFGLGAFQQGQCADGADFVCGPKTSKGITVNSCRPCDFAQLAAFKELQNLANSLVVALGLSRSPAIITGPSTCSGGDILALDGRVGPCTARTITRIMGVGPDKLTPIDPLLSAANFQPTQEYIAHALPEIVSYMRQLATLTSAPRDVPAPPQQPISTTAGGPGPGPGEEAIAVVPPLPVLPKRKASGLAITVGVLGALAAVGLVGAGINYQRGRY